MVTKRIDRIVFAIISVISLIIFYPLVHTFYQQDEWMAHGHFLVEGPSAFIDQYSFIGLLAGGGRLPAQLFQYLLFTRFPFNIGLLSWIAIIIHILNGILVYRITREMVSSRILSFVSAIFFVITSSSQQAVTWIGASTNTLPSATFALLSVWHYVRFIKKERKFDQILSFIFLFISYFMKQSSIFLFLFYPVWYVITKNFSVNTVKKSFKIHLALFAFLFLIILPTFLEIFTREQTSVNVAASNNPVVDLVSHAVSYPMNSLSQMYFFPGAMFSLARMFRSDLSPQQIENVGANTASFICSLLLLGVFFYLFKRNKTHRHFLLFALLYTLMSFLPFIALKKGHAYLDSRYFYLGAAGGGMLFSGLILLVRKLTEKSGEYLQQIAISILFLLMGVYGIFQIVFIRQEIEKQIILADHRISFLKQINQLYPAMPQNAAVFMTGNTEHIVSGNYAPFQQGGGFTLMVWYYERGNIPAELIKHNRLWGIQEQGYYEAAQGGFGYYSQFERLQEDFSAGKLRDAQIIGLYYNGHTKTLENITTQVKEELEKS